MNAHTVNLLSSMPPMLERYELKYVIPHEFVEPISDYLSLYCGLDAHSSEHADGFYPVSSLYFDTRGYRFLKLRQNGADRRFNMRIRAYGDEGDGPYFAEIKYKTPTSVKKFRARLASSEWPSFLESDAGAISGQCDREKSNRELFLHLATSYAIEPKIFTCYKRRAFVSDVDEYARVTFDVDMRYRAQDPLGVVDAYAMKTDDNCINYDAETIYGDEARYQASVILELKATIGAVPLWMIELIRRFELKQVGFSKYMNSSMAEHVDNGWDYMACDRASSMSFA